MENDNFKFIAANFPTWTKGDAAACEANERLQEMSEYYRRMRKRAEDRAAELEVQLHIAREALLACERVLTIITDCSGQVFHANDVRPELSQTRAALVEIEK